MTEHNKLPDAEIRQRTLLVACGELAEILKDLCFAANAPFNEARAQRIGNATAGLDRTTRRLRIAVLGQPDYPHHDDMLLLVKEVGALRKQVGELTAREAPLDADDLVAAHNLDCEQSGFSELKHCEVCGKPPGEYCVTHDGEETMKGCPRLAKQLAEGG